VASLCCSPLSHSLASWHFSRSELAPSRSALLSPLSTATATATAPAALRLSSSLTSFRARVGCPRHCLTTREEEFLGDGRAGAGRAPHCTRGVRGKAPEGR
jgi:hypothetical protein